MRAERVHNTVLWSIFGLGFLVLLWFFMVCTGIVGNFPQLVVGWLLSDVRVVEDPAAEFTERTGFAWPESASLVVVGDTHNGVLADGEFYLVFDANRETLEKWLSAHPPWGESEWQKGPVPFDVSTGDFGGNRTHSAVLSSSEIKYCAEDSKWYGSILAINMRTKRVYLSCWEI